MTAFSLGGVFAVLGIRYDQRRWLALLVGSIVAGFLLLMLLWHGFA